MGLNAYSCFRIRSTFSQAKSWTRTYTKPACGLQYSYATAIGVFKSVVGLFLISIANTISKKATGESLY